MPGTPQSAKKAITTCIYCINSPDGQEHWLNRSLGKFQGNSLLTGRICTPCNEKLGGTIDLELARTGHSGVFRQVLGIEGRASHERKNVFEYKASHTEPPVQTFRVDGDNLTPMFQDAVALNADGTLKATEGRLLVVATADGQEHELRFPKSWGQAQLRAAVEARGLLGARPVKAHVPGPETLAEFEAVATPVIRAVFGAFVIDVYTTDLDNAAAPVVPMLLRFNLSREYLRAVAKVALHYFLWSCPQVGGDESDFSSVKAFIRNDVGEPMDVLRKADSLIDRIPTSHGGPGDHGHAFTSVVSADRQLLVQVHLFSLNVGPSFPTFVVRLGDRPDALPADWRSAHIAVYQSNIPGHDGILKRLCAEDLPPP